MTLTYNALIQYFIMQNFHVIQEMKKGYLCLFEGYYRSEKALQQCGQTVDNLKI